MAAQTQAWATASDARLLVPLDAVIAEVAVPSTWRVLIADDNVVVRSSVRFLLRRVDAAWNIGETETAEDAIALAAGQPYDLIIMDEHFGENRMTGTEATGIMRTAGVTGLIVGLTGDAHLPGHAERALQEGQDFVLTKPFTDMKRFRRILQRLIYNRKQRGRPSSAGSPRCPLAHISTAPSSGSDSSGSGECNEEE